MKTPISVTEVVRNFADVINRVVYRREGFLLERGGRPVARLIPLPQAGRLGDLLRILDSAPRLEEAEADAFSKDLVRARESLSHLPPGDPWAS
jgi:antitoxin (DNA-binding transcriptional repressor) of toxin-antitoxin stability system